MLIGGHKKSIVIIVGLAVVVLAALALSTTIVAGRELSPAKEAKVAQAADPAAGPRRGCTACHVPGGIDADGKYSLLWEAKERAAAASPAQQHPLATRDGTPLTYQSSVEACLTCHRPGTDDRAGRGASAPLALRDIVHPAHMYSTPFKEEYNGSCFTCHNVAGDGTWELLSQKVDVNEKGVPARGPIPGALRPSESW